MAHLPKLVSLATVSLAAWCLAPACGGQQALDVTAPQEGTSTVGEGDDGSEEPPAPKAGTEKPAEQEAWAPCEEKKCGTPCTECNPTDEGCDEVQVLKACDGKGACVMAPVDCAAPEPEKGKEGAKPKAAAAPKAEPKAK
jgi:hypothetical protein